MAGTRHQFILGLLVKWMREQNILIEGIDGDYPGLFGNKIAMPPTILNHRPDIIGVRENGQICIGEAKTESDLNNFRTHSQLRNFASVELNGQLCDVFIGIPRSSSDAFKRLLLNLGLSECHNIKLLCVPDELING